MRGRSARSEETAAARNARFLKTDSSALPDGVLARGMDSIRSGPLIGKERRRGKGIAREVRLFTPPWGTRRVSTTRVVPRAETCTARLDAVEEVRGIWESDPRASKSGASLAGPQVRERDQGCRLTWLFEALSEHSDWSLVGTDKVATTLTGREP